MNKKGISLISLIITIIVVIILAAIAIFSGFGTIEKANLAKFTSEFSDYEAAMQNEFLLKKQNYALEGTPKSDDEIYAEIAGTATPVDITTDSRFAEIKDQLQGVKAYQIASPVGKFDGVKKFGEQTYVTEYGEVVTLKPYEQKNDDGTSTKYYSGWVRSSAGATVVEPGSEVLSLKEGDYVNYTPKTAISGASWRVWKVVGDTVEIVPTTPTNNPLIINRADYPSAGTIMDNEAAEYTSNTLNTTARAMKAEDILAKFDQNGGHQDQFRHTQSLSSYYKPVTASTSTSFTVVNSNHHKWADNAGNFISDTICAVGETIKLSPHRIISNTTLSTSVIPFLAGNQFGNPNLTFMLNTPNVYATTFNNDTGEIFGNNAGNTRTETQVKIYYGVSTFNGKDITNYLYMFDKQYSGIAPDVSVVYVSDGANTTAAPIDKLNHRIMPIVTISNYEIVGGENAGDGTNLKPYTLTNK